MVKWQKKFRDLNFSFIISKKYSNKPAFTFLQPKILVYTLGVNFKSLNVRQTFRTWSRFGFGK